MGRVKAALNGRERYRGKAYFFKDTSYLRYDWGQDRTDYGPAGLHLWNLPAPFDQGFDAALNGEGFYNGIGFLFRGNEYLRYDWRNERADGGSRSLDIWGLPGNFGLGIGAALSGDLLRSGQAFLFRGDEYVIEDWATDVITGPFPLSDWNLPGGFAQGFDTAVNGQGRYAGKAYFFRGEEYIRYDWLTNQVDGPARPIAGNWPGLELLPGDPTFATVSVKLNDAVPLPYVDGVEQFLAPLLGGVWDSFAGTFPFVTFRRTYSSLTPAELTQLMNDAAANSGNPQPNLLSFYMVHTPPAQADAVAAALAALPVVQFAYVLPALELQAVNPADDPLFVEQTHHQRPPRVRNGVMQVGGLNSEYAWDFKGGDGSGVRFCVVENNFKKDHPDLPHVTFLHGVLENFKDTDLWHGTAGLGIVAAVDNSVGTVGIAPHVTAAFASKLEYTGNVRVENLPNALTAVLGKFRKAGEPLVVLAMISANEQPIENDPTFGPALQVLVDNDITVVTSAGNYTKGIAPAADTGCIVVGAAYLETTLQQEVLERRFDSNFGARVDCFAQGHRIRTLHSDRTPPYGFFQQTSGAAAIIAGAAACVHGMAKAANASLKPRQVRDKLRDPTINTKHFNWPTRQIGVMPDLRKIAHSIGLIRPLRTAAARQDANRVHLVAIDDESNFASREWNASAATPAWSALSPKDGGWFAARRPAVICRTDQIADAFMVSTTGQLHTSFWTKNNNQWSAPAPIGGGPILAPTASVGALARMANHIDVFAIGNDGQIYTTWWDSAVPTGWFALTPTSNGVLCSLDSGLATILTKHSLMMVFAIRADGRLAFGAFPSAPGGTSWHNPFTPMTPSKVALGSTPAAAAPPGTDLVFAFCIGQFAHLRMTFTTATATPASMQWPDLVLISPNVLVAPDGMVAAVVRKPDTVDVFVIGFDKHLYHTSWASGVPPTQWSPLQAIGGTAESLSARAGISAVARNENDMHVIVCNEKGQLLTTRWQPATGWSALTALP